MTMFSSTASPGQRWKMFLPGKLLPAPCDALSVSTAAAFLRSQWLSDGGADYHRRRSLARGAGLRPLHRRITELRAFSSQAAPCRGSTL